MVKRKKKNSGDIDISLSKMFFMFFFRDGSLKGNILSRIIYERSLLSCSADKSKFGLFTNSRLTHQAPNRISLADDDMMGLLDRLHANEHANNTAIIFFGDHGAR